ncbi:cytochrome P450 [Mucidula mucida]|nr:cytochrome P450 [Mucidula mucida]
MAFADASSKLIFLVLAASVYLLLKRPRRQLPYPPGPKGYPLIGNLLDVPDSFQWLRYTEWAKVYGDLIHFRVFGMHMFLINSVQVAQDLFDKRSRVYSDRPEIAVMSMNGWHINMGLKHYGDDWRRDRRLLHQRLRREESSKLHPVEMNKTRELLTELLNAPKKYHHHFEVLPASIMIYAMYGYDAAPNDPFLDIVFEIGTLFGGSVFPGMNLVNAIPPLRHLPKWFPIPMLQELHRRCDRCRVLLGQVQDIPLKSVKGSMAEGTSVPSWMADLLTKNEIEGAQYVPEDIIKALGIVSAALSSFVLAMILFPDIQARAQAELDAVVGTDRLPTFDDRKSLPYIEALMREVLRWHPPPPLGVPHATSADDVYNGYYIPKGRALILYNQWAMCRDERVYDNAEAFNPERFLSPDGGVTEHYPPVFGFGRRICVGRWAADASLWIAMASILAVFQLGKAKDELGNEIEVTENYSDSIVCAPVPFECAITPRTESARLLVLDNPPTPLESIVMLDANV